jgi:hypothetical protein
MAMVTVFDLTTMNVDKYNKVIKDLEAAGQGMPKGRSHHVSTTNADGHITVTDVWDSQADLDEFGKTLVPVLQQAGVTPVPPVVSIVHNVIKGE